ncbi:hypothetical protein Q4491_11955 [Photobacterium sp. 2_MG-2023]|uniref:hypothetical protein n=1 Tax=Photobacterium sp. 2_MG-2023 TaxID=3062663 RepID=UPI0026E2E180|nr:hypothetical protein [Photobacterium sp. 2_MG-2023]MDO6582053.1 hypothetical protein [Photobacterium sp. 2_MG-2023]
MLEMASKSAEWLLLLSGVTLILTSMVQYGRRTRNWGGVMTMFYKRVSMTAIEFKFYRSGVAAVILAIVLRMVNLIFWP